MFVLTDFREPEGRDHSHQRRRTASMSADDEGPRLPDCVGGHGVLARLQVARQWRAVVELVDRQLDPEGFEGAGVAAASVVLGPAAVSRPPPGNRNAKSDTVE